MTTFLNPIAWLRSLASPRAPAPSPPPAAEPYVYVEPKYRGPRGEFYIFDKYDDYARLYRVTGAPTKNQALMFMSRKLDRGSSAEGLRFEPERKDEWPGFTSVRFQAARRRAPRKRRRTRR